MTGYAQHVADYLRLRRSLGYKLHEHERLLRRFAAHLDAADADFVTIELALAWALHETALVALQRYARRRDELCPSPREASFFVSLRGTRLYPCAVQQTFRRLCQTAGVGADAPFAPRLHDLRHTLAVRTLLGWYRDGGDVQLRLPALSTYLGHRDPSYTYYYLSAAPELLAHAAGLLDTAQEARS
jgi:integrase/recombinase XerD